MARAQKSRSNTKFARWKSKSRATRNHRAKLKPQDVKLELQIVHPRAAVIDAGNEEHLVVVPPELDSHHPVQSFGFGGAVSGMAISHVVGFLLQFTGSYVPAFLMAGFAYLVALAAIHLPVPKLEPARL
jgi:hypothetical protein